MANEDVAVRKELEVELQETPTKTRNRRAIGADFGDLTPKNEPQMGVEVQNHRKNGHFAVGNTISRQGGAKGGRPAILQEVRDLAINASPEAMNKLITLMRSDRDSVAISAAEKVLKVAGALREMAVEAPVVTPANALDVKDLLRVAMGVAAAPSGLQPDAPTNKIN